MQYWFSYSIGTGFSPFKIRYEFLLALAKTYFTTQCSQSFIISIEIARKGVSLSKEIIRKHL